MAVRSAWLRQGLAFGVPIFVGVHVLPAAYLAATEWPYFVRLVTFAQTRPITDVAFYEPLAKVAGAPDGALALASPGELPAPVAAEVTALARAMGSSAFVVLHRGRIVVEAYFSGDAGSTTNAMSMVKTVVALLVGIAIDDGAIGSIDDPIGRYLPEWSDARGDITLRQLLEMAAGLRRSDDLWNPWSDLVRLFLGDDIVATALAVPSAQPPGERFRYNNVNTPLLALALERATGLSIQEYLSRRLWQPLGASDAGWWLDRPGGTARTFCCLFATAKDWARVGQLMLDGGVANGRRIVPAAWIARMLQPSALTPRYGLHVWLADPGEDRDGEPFLDPGTFRLDGKDQQRVWVVPSEQLVIVRVGEGASDWDETVLPNTLVRGLRAAAAR